MPRPTERDEHNVWRALAELAAAADDPEFEIDDEPGEPCETTDAERHELIDAAVAQTLERSARQVSA